MESNNYSSVLKNNLILLRRNAKMTQEQFAEKLGLSFQAVSKWENGLSCPDITLLPQIAQIYGVTIDQLFTPISPENLEKPAGEPESEASKAERAYYGDIHLDEALSYLSQKAQQVGAAVGQSASDLARTAQRMAKAAWAAREEPPYGDGEQGVLIAGLPWENDGLYRAALFRGRKQVSEAVVAGEHRTLAISDNIEGDIVSAFSSWNCGVVEGDICHVNGPLIVTDSIEGDVIQCGDLVCDTIEGDAIQCSDFCCTEFEGERVYNMFSDHMRRYRFSSPSEKPAAGLPNDRIYRALLFRGQVLLTVPTEDGAGLVSYASEEELNRFHLNTGDIEGDVLFSLGNRDIIFSGVEGDIYSYPEQKITCSGAVEGDVVQCGRVLCQHMEGDIIQCNSVSFQNKEQEPEQE